MANNVECLNNEIFRTFKIRKKFRFPENSPVASLKTTTRNARRALKFDAIVCGSIAIVQVPERKGSQFPGPTKANKKDSKFLNNPPQ